ncbi:MAG TPA: ATP-dependent DNA ligase [Candidatus Saccharimonadia bacterium]|nr:ATP-dependent DNA ligase [Candidatus Saccharimonadia bacterium]
MRRFAALFHALDTTTATSEKVAAMAEYFAQAPPADAAWALVFLTGSKLKRVAGAPLMRALVVEASGYEEWLVDECYGHVGDLAETITLLVDAHSDAEADVPLSSWVARLAELPQLPEDRRGSLILEWWHAVPSDQRFLLNKLMTGALRVGVSQRLVVQALAKLSGLPTETIAHRLAGNWDPSAESLRALLAVEDDPVMDADKPYPFFLASPLEAEPGTLGAVDEWLAEWKWDGIRAQVLKRHGVVRIWSRGEERLDGRFPEVEAAAALLPDGTVLDGEILGWAGGSSPLPFGALQKRIGRLKPGPKSLADCPIVLLAYDVLEVDGADVRTAPLVERRAMLDRVLARVPAAIRRSPALPAESWDALSALRTQSRERGVEGLILKRMSSPYQVGRRRGDWWKWKVDPYTIDAVLVYSQPGSGRRSNLFTDHTFALWDEDRLVPVAKAYSGLTDAEIAKLDRWIRANTLERFGPVRSVKPEQVFELAFEAINRSTRHKSGVAVRFPRIVRWRGDKPAPEADRLETLRGLAGGG